MRSARLISCILALLVFVRSSVWAEPYVSIKQGYFWNPELKSGKGAAWIPRGIAYQTWNKPLGQWQTHEEVTRDLDAMQALGADALRVDFVWNAIEPKENEFSWENYDFLLAEAQKRKIKVFALIGYQWPPEWFAKDLYTAHPPDEKHPQEYWPSDIMSYENPDARAKFAKFLKAVAGRYSHGGERANLGSAVAAWILGNEYGYIGLWSVLNDGYDSASIAAFRTWLKKKYAGKISDLNARWQTDFDKAASYLPGFPFENFESVAIPTPFGPPGSALTKFQYKYFASWHDLNQWRKLSIADFVAFAAAAVRAVDKKHLITYSAVGMHWGNTDNDYQAEDPATIVARCRERGVPLDFWSINIYPYGVNNTAETATVKWGMSFAQHATGLPVFATETGYTSTETYYRVDEGSQGALIRDSFWDILSSGGIGANIFHWHDRDYHVLPREQGYGIVRLNREQKPAYSWVKQAFGIIDSANLPALLVGSKEETPDIAFFYEDAVDTISKRYFLEVSGLFAALERLGYEPTFINKQELLRGDYKKFRVIVFPRNEKMSARVFKKLPQIVKSGVKLFANADLPGLRDEYGNVRSMAEYNQVLRALFGIEMSPRHVSGSEEAENREADVLIHLHNNLLGLHGEFRVWKYDSGLRAVNAEVLANFEENNQAPAVLIDQPKAVGKSARSAINLFGLGYSDFGYQERFVWLRQIFGSGLRLLPKLEQHNPEILIDYRFTKGRSVLLSLRNLTAKRQSVDLVTPLVKGKQVVNLFLAPNEAQYLVDGDGDEKLQFHLEPDDFMLLLAQAQ